MIFSRLLRSRVEVELESLYTSAYVALTGEPSSKARKTVRDAIKACKAEAVRQGTDKLPDNFGTLLVRRTVEIPLQLQAMVQAARDEGARDVDIEEWWNLPDLARRMVLWNENVVRYANYLSYLDQGHAPENAMAQVRSLFAMYGDPRDTSHVQGDDRLLPHELRGRVDEYTARRGAEFVVGASKPYSTFNAFVREQLRTGGL